MNAIGRLGEIIIKYQGPIMAAVITVAVAVLIVAVVKAIRTAGRNKELLNQINDTVTEISSNVNNIKGKDKEPVIYIDNRSSERHVSSDELKNDEGKGILRSSETVDEINVKVHEPEEEEPPMNEAEQPEDVVSDSAQIPVKARKYLSRDCSVDRHGRKYTIEELEKQIKE